MLAALGCLAGCIVEDHPAAVDSVIGKFTGTYTCVEIGESEQYISSTEYPELSELKFAVSVPKTGEPADLSCRANLDGTWSDWMLLTYAGTDVDDDGDRYYAFYLPEDNGFSGLALFWLDWPSRGDVYLEIQAYDANDNFAGYIALQKQ